MLRELRSTKEKIAVVFNSLRMELSAACSRAHRRAVRHPTAAVFDKSLPSSGAQRPCISTLNFTAHAYEKEGGENMAKTIEVRDTILLRLKRRLTQTV